MGFLDFLRPRNPLEERLVKVYGAPLATLLGSAEEADATIRNLIRKIKDSYGGAMPSRGLFGEEILKVEKADPQRREYFQWARSEGVTDADIRAWWNVHQLERDLLAELDDLYRTYTFLRKKRLGLDDQDAAEETRKLYARYGRHDDATGGAGPHRVLPVELRARVDRYVRMRCADRVLFQLDLDRAGSLNALVRAEILAKKL